MCSGSVARYGFQSLLRWSTLQHADRIGQSWACSAWLMTATHGWYTAVGASLIVHFFQTLVGLAIFRSASSRPSQPFQYHQTIPRQSAKARQCGAFARVLETTRLSSASMWDPQGLIQRPVWWAVFPISGIPLRASTRPVHFRTTVFNPNDIAIGQPNDLPALAFHSVDMP